MGTETELKLRLEPAGLRHLRNHPLLKALKRARAQTRQQTSVYFDTPDRLLRRQNAVLRVRHIGARRIQTVKTMGDCLGGAWARGEWEHEIAGDHPRIDLLAGTEMAETFADQRLAAALQPIFTTDVKRTVHQLGQDAWEVELALDEGQIIADQGSLPILEVELELKAGEPRHLFDLALQLQEGLAGRLLTVSKAERGYALVDALRPTPQKAKPVILDAQGSAAAACQAIARSCVAQLLANQDCLSETRNPEAVHQMRVAIRRLRSAINIFGAFLDTPDTAALKEELRWLGNHLGAARDIDVFIDEILSPMAPRFGDEPGFAGLRAQFDEDRRRAYDQASALLGDPRLTRLLLALGRWTEGGDWLDSEDPARRALLDRPVTALAEETLVRRDRKLHKKLRHMAELPPEQRHEGRIQVKKLRYAVEFFASLYSEKKARKVAAALGQLQDQLGLLNDIAVARHMLRERAEASGDPVRLWAAGLLAGWHQSQIQPLIGQAEDGLRLYDKLPRYWKKG